MRPQTFVYMGFDETGSMDRFSKHKVMQAYNDQLESFRRAERNGQDVYVSIFPIREQARAFRVRDARPSMIPNISDYNPDARRTAIVDSCVYALREATARMKLYPDASFLFVVITDGGENVNHQYALIANQINNLSNTDRWTFAFSVPNGYRSLARKFGAFDGNIHEWDTTSDAGLADMAHTNTTSNEGYFNLRSKGVGATRGFYQTNITPQVSRAIERETERVNRQNYQWFCVPKDTKIMDFFKEKNIPFRQGQLFYELTKPEEVQPRKRLVLQDRMNPETMFHGAHARELLNLPTHANINVHPGVHGKWRIFVQSTSNNRKLVGGTSVLIEK